MNRLTRSQIDLQGFEFPDLGRNIELDMAADDESFDANQGAPVDGGKTGGGAAPAKAPEKVWEPKWGFQSCNLSRGILFKKTRGLLDDKKFEVSTKDAVAIFKYLVGKEPSLGEVVTCIPVAHDDTGRPTKISNLIQQHQ